MMKLLFRNRWIALAWAAAMLVSVAVFFSDGGGHDMLEEATSELASRQRSGDDVPNRDESAAEQVSHSDASRPEPVTWYDPPSETASEDDSESIDDSDNADTYIILDNNPPVEEVESSEG